MQKKKFLASLTLLALGLYGCQMPSSGVNPAGGPNALVVDSAITGLVRDAQGNPVAGALVQAIADGAGPKSAPYVAVTDGSGRFSVGVPRNGRFNLTVQSVQLGQSAIRYGLMSTTFVDVTLQPTGVFRGTLNLGDLDEKGAVVFIPGTSFMAIADENGSYTITGVPVTDNGYATFGITLDGYQPWFVAPTGPATKTPYVVGNDAASGDVNLNTTATGTTPTRLHAYFSATSFVGPIVASSAHTLPLFADGTSASGTQDIVGYPHIMATGSWREGKKASDTIQITRPGRYLVRFQVSNLKAYDVTTENQATGSISLRIGNVIATGSEVELTNAASPADHNQYHFPVSGETVVSVEKDSSAAISLYFQGSEGQSYSSLTKITRISLTIDQISPVTGELD